MRTMSKVFEFYIDFSINVKYIHIILTINTTDVKKKLQRAKNDIYYISGIDSLVPTYNRCDMYIFLTKEKL